MAQDMPSQLHKRYFGLAKFAEFIRHGCRMNGCMFGHIMQNKEICTELLEKTSVDNGFLGQSPKPSPEKGRGLR